MMHAIVQDLRFALRQLRRTPVFALTLIVTLALGIGANTAIFSLLDQALLRALPVHSPQQLVVLRGTGKAWDGSSHSYGGDPEYYFSYPMYKDLRDKNQAFDGLIATMPAGIGIARNNLSVLGRAELVTGNYFKMLGVQPAMGRVLQSSDEGAPGANPVVVLSYAFWKNTLGADASVVGNTLRINGQPFQVAGVAAPGFQSVVWGETPDVFVPITMLDQVMPGQGKRLITHTDRGINLIGRLKQGETREQAQVSLAPLWHALRAAELKGLGDRSPRFVDGFLTHSRLELEPGGSGFSYQRGDLKDPLVIVMAMALLMLLIACVNVASLLLVRSAGRVREFSVRYALGARSGRIVQQLLMEGLLIGLGGGAAGLLLTPFAVRALVHQLAGEETHVAFTTGMDVRLMLINFAAAVAVSVLFSFAPSLQLRRLELTQSLRQQSGTGSGAMLSFRRVIVCLQVGLSVVLLAVAGLCVRSVQNLRHVDVGFATTHLVTFGVNPKLAGYQDASLFGVQERMMQVLAALPGVQTVAATNDPELAGSNHGGNVTVQGYTPGPDDDYDVEEPNISPEYFSTLRVPLLAGRFFTDADAAGGQKVAIVNESFAKHFCGAPAACLGRMMGTGAGDRVKLELQIVGIVRDFKHSDLRTAPPPTFYRPLKQMPPAGQLHFYLRTASDSAQTLNDVRTAMRRLDASLALDGLHTMEEQIDSSLSEERMVSMLALAFGALTTLLAGVGLYGVLAYSTAQRTAEIGIRMALGSSRMGVAKIVLGDVLRMAGIGVVVALPLSVAASHTMKQQLFGVTAFDPLTMLAVTVLIFAVAMMAALLPARRAASVNPVQALRAE